MSTVQCANLTLRQFSTVMFNYLILLHDGIQHVKMPRDSYPPEKRAGPATDRHWDINSKEVLLGDEMVRNKVAGWFQNVSDTVSHP